MYCNKGNGFTLIELMIVVAVIAILSTIAVPAYTDYVTRSRITEATSELSARRLLSEQHLQDNRTYVDVGVHINRGCTPASTANFAFSCTELVKDRYTIQASGLGSMAGFIYTIDHNATRATLGVKAGWINPAVSCGWVRNRDGSC